MAFICPSGPVLGCRSGARRRQLPILFYALQHRLNTMGCSSFQTRRRGDWVPFTHKRQECKTGHCRDVQVHEQCSQRERVKNETVKTTNCGLPSDLSASLSSSLSSSSSLGDRLQRVTLFASRVSHRLHVSLSKRRLLIMFVAVVVN